MAPESIGLGCRVSAKGGGQRFIAPMPTATTAVMEDRKIGQGKRQGCVAMGERAKT